MKSLILVLTLSLICTAGGCSDGKPGKLAKEAYLSLKKIEAQTETSVSYRDYVQAVSEAKYAVNIFIESNENKNTPIRKSISVVMNQYLWCVKIWGETTKSEVRVFAMSLDSDLYKYFETTYPRFLKEGKEKGALLNNQLYLNGKMLTQYLWQEATSELKKISHYFK